MAARRAVPTTNAAAGTTAVTPSGTHMACQANQASRPRYSRYTATADPVLTARSAFFAAGRALNQPITVRYCCSFMGKPP